MGNENKGIKPVTGEFDEEKNCYFESCGGAYTQFTDAEIKHRVYCVKAVIRDMLIEKLGNDFFLKQDTGNNTITFKVCNKGNFAEIEAETIDIVCNYKEKTKRVMSIFFHKRDIKLFKGGDYWYIYFKENESEPYIGVMSKDNWETIKVKTSSESKQSPKGDNDYENIYMVHDFIRADNMPERIILINEFVPQTTSQIVPYLGHNSIYAGLHQGDYIYLSNNGTIDSTANDNPIVTGITNEINNSISNIDTTPGSDPEDLGKADHVYSYHVNIGHGNFSIIVYRTGSNNSAWVVDSSSYDFLDKTNAKKYKDNFDKCIDFIQKKHIVDCFSKLLVTHQHFDHINGISELIKCGLINNDTEVWLNKDYFWSGKTYSDILKYINSNKLKVVMPIVTNSTRSIEILYPSAKLHNPTHPVKGFIDPPDKDINNASVVYKINIGGKSMVFPGDIEYGGWKAMSYSGGNVDYYAISHHGSDNGVCICTILNKELTKINKNILMGRDGAYSGIYGSIVRRKIGKQVYALDNISFLELDWISGILTQHI
ncbi:hypothetical protein [Butyrivibrio fibrisolvens]|uniref:hypothetical protein n=1 Tax=Butyrivibrio fibrisolvens TaxID=831 RepID=UPI0003B4E145|nr:hypothetical protein [Butyrivibrio fibrisolvens]